jgi:hypothetical protein
MSFSFEILRAADLLTLQVDAINLKLDGSNPEQPKLVIDAASQPAYLIIQFPPQSITERAYYETENDGPGSDALDPAGSVPVRMAGPSRLVFQFPKNLKQIPFTIASLLDWSQFDLVVSPTAVGQAIPPPIVAPTDQQTALELPYRIILAPSKPVGWLHATAPVTHAGRTELWHTRIGKFVDVKTKTGTTMQLVEAADTSTVPLRAIWTPGFQDHVELPDPGAVYPFPAAMVPRDRSQLVILTSGVTGYFVATPTSRTSPWIPLPIQASRLFLSALGGWLSSRGNWPQQPYYRPNDGGAIQQLDISQWTHIATQGRDHYVRIVYEGFLYPFGHRAALVKVTERKIVPADGVNVLYPTAYLKQYEYIVVNEPEKVYPTASFIHGAREMPLYQNVRIRTKVTPYIDKPQFIPEPNPTNPSQTQNSPSFWVDVGGQHFPFHVTGVDLAGKSIDFLAPLIFMDIGETNPDAIAAFYRAAGDARMCSVSGIKLAYADPAAGDTTLKTNGLFFDTEMPPNLSPPYTEVPFIPILDTARVTVPSVEQIIGSSTPITVQLYDRYLASDLDPHAAVFAQITGTPTVLTFSADKAGGFSTPNLTLTGLSAKKGLIAGSINDAADGVIKPAEFFSDLSAKLFGTVPLQALIPVDGGGNAPADQNAPEIRTSFSPNAKNPDTEIVKLSWSPQLQPYKQDPVHVDINQNGQTSALTLGTKLTRSLTGAAPQSQINGEFTNFQITLLGVVAISFNSLKFNSQNGQKLIVKADLPSSSPITFIGPLEFVQKLADILPPGIFGGKGPSIQLQSDKIRVTYTLGLPPISVGVFSLEHIAIMVGVDLPYLDGKPAFEFAFASRSAPFLITVECLGGGGFVHLIVDADGVQMVEGALEFGGEFSLSLVVASGAVHIMAGIYFKLSGSDSDLTGFVDVGGEVSVLGIISISIDLNLSLSYEVSNGKKMVQGKATLTVSIHILFFSASVAITMEKSFGASSGDPHIQDVLTAQNWADYAAAYA